MTDEFYGTMHILTFAFHCHLWVGWSNYISHESFAFVWKHTILHKEGVLKTVFSAAALMTSDLAVWHLVVIGIDGGVMIEGFFLLKKMIEGFFSDNCVLYILSHNAGEEEVEHLLSGSLVVTVC